YTTVFEHIAAYDVSAPAVNLTQGDPPEALKAARVSADYSAVFGAKVAYGRTFTAKEDRPGGPRVVAISDGLWRRRFGGDPGLLDWNIPLENEWYRVIGILAPGLAAEPPADTWLPLRADSSATDPISRLRVAAR